MDDLILLWHGVPFGESHKIRAALLTVTADMPAMRKLTQFLGHKADLGCSRCKFRAEREPGTVGASGRMSYLTPHGGAISRSHQEVIQQADEYNRAPTKTAAATIAQKNGVRYSELLRLPYFDIVRMSTTDPMHTFLLGMVKRETSLNLQLLDPTQRKVFLRRLKSMRVPYDIGRLPTNIFDVGEEQSGVTAAQWKLYIITYARPCLYQLLPDRAYKCLVLLSQIVSIIASPVIGPEKIDSLRKLLMDHHLLYSQVYGKWAVTVNYHMSLHLPEIMHDLGPPQSFWCFGYERLNGILAGTPNSNRSVEIEVNNRFVHEMSVCCSNVSRINLADIPSILQPIISTPTEEYITSLPLSHHLMMRLQHTYHDRFECQQELDRGNVNGWPIELRHPCKRNVRINHEFLGELQAFFDGLYGDDLEYIQPRIHKFGRCSVNGITFSSDFNSTDRGSVVKVMFADVNNDLIPYFGVVRFYFKATTVIKKCSKVHCLAYVTWLRFKDYAHQKTTQLYGVTNREYVNDRILSPRRFMCRCVLVPPKSSVPFFLVSELTR